MGVPERICQVDGAGRQRLQVPSTNFPCWPRRRPLVRGTVRWRAP